ncbi:SDR family oxidoreductase [Pseudohalioglobus lutimaris]|uniref:Short chain dehydrogenase n=1 Tax=Pseudohalioglobus lutimaris TaxID=1737061 RepID=A0A2N5X7X1_9GAMM|nr:SDR family oxidoreductase [Pseudohalioglobus lutimaris]PLW70568.1 short chain dehydrogenase [Pseudohalioglobus lutimaris]
MSYFVTGATGFIGKFLVEKLLQREGLVYVLARRESQHKVDALKERYAMAADRIVPVYGDLSEPLLGLDEGERQKMRGQVKHFFHVAAIYDLNASAESQQIANVEGTRNAVACAQDIEAGCFQHVSSIAVGGKYQGTFREGMFEEAGDLAHPYFRTKHDSEAIVRKECEIPWRVYRPASVVGHSETGEIDKADGPYYSFQTLSKLRKALPPWFPLIGVDMGSFNIVPVDYVVSAMDYIAHKEDCDSRAFHLTNPDHYGAGEMMNIFAEAAKAPRFALRLDTNIFSFIPSNLVSMLSKLPPVKRMMATAMESIGMPVDATMFFTWNTKFDNRETEIALRGSGIEVPELKSYATRLWDYWERNLDPELFIDRSLAGNIGGKVVIITGGGTGIGLASAIRLGEAGAKVILSGRTMETLEDAKRRVAEVGGEAHIYQCDASVMEACDAFIDQVIADHGRVDVLINNAGRSIRRAVEHSYDRFHDFERTMQINYFGALRLSLRVLPGMTERRSGHIINISSMGVVGPPARFSSYIASKSALEGWTRCAEAEFCNRNIAFTNINMPLVRTPMIGPTAIYDVAPTLSPEQAADMVVDAVINRPSRIVTGMGRMFQIWHLVAPKLAATAMNIPFSMFDESALSKGMKKPEKVEASSEQVAIAALMKGVHF